MKNYVSCICPTYARPRFVEQAIKLFLRQSWGQSELIILDDSPEGQRASVQDSKRVKIIRLKDRTPMGEKHNIGLDAAQGDFIAHFDDDDWQSHDRLTRQLETLLLQDADLCGFPTGLLLTCGDARFWRFDPHYGPRIGLVGNSVIDYGVPFMDGSAMVRRSVIGATRYPSMTTGQKVVFLHTIWKAGAKLVKMPNNGMYVYVRHDRNTWQYGRDRRLLPIERPIWFPAADVDFYRRAA